MTKIFKINLKENLYKIQYKIGLQNTYEGLKHRQENDYIKFEKGVCRIPMRD